MKLLIATLFTSLIQLGESSIQVVNESTVIVYHTPEENGFIDDIIRYGTEVQISPASIGQWVHITYPGLDGWVLKKSLLEIQENYSLKANAWVAAKGAYLFDRTDTRWGPLLALPFETPLQVIEELPEENNRWLKVKLQDGKEAFIQRSQVIFEKRNMTQEEMIHFSREFLGLKYLWGGTSSFGFDCSGFVQMLYRQIGIDLPRNSCDQAKDPRFEEVMDAKPGDLIFFENGKGHVVHVGLILNEKEFIHAFTKQEAWICISEINEKPFTNGSFYCNKIFKRLIINP